MITKYSCSSNTNTNKSASWRMAFEKQIIHILKHVILILTLIVISASVYGQKETKIEFVLNISAPGDGWDIPNQKFRVDVFPRGGEKGKETVLLSVHPLSDDNNNTNIKRVKYRGRLYNVPENMVGMELNKSFQHWIDHFKYTVNIEGKDYSGVWTLGGGGTILPVSYDWDSRADFRITNLRVTEVKYKEESLQRMVDAINERSQETSASNRPSIVMGEQQTNTQVSIQNTENTNKDIGQAIADYNASEKAKGDALNAATAETTSQWAQGNYIQGAKPLADEFARQGSAVGAYGTVGVAVAAEVGSIIADARAKRKAREAEEAAYNYEVDQGDKALRNRSYKDALKWYYSSYQQQKNVLLSATHVGYMLMRGLGTEANYSEAFKFLNEAAEGYKSSKKDGGAALFLLAEMYREGLGVPKNPYKAYQLMEEATKKDESFFVYSGYNGIGEAYYHLAFFNLAGIGTPQNFQKAYDIFIAFVGGDLKNECNFGLGVIYYYGLGMKKDLKTAVRYLKAASTDGNSDTLALIKKICDNNEVTGKELSDLQDAYNKALSKKYVNRITNNTLGEFLTLN